MSVPPTQIPRPTPRSAVPGTAGGESSSLAAAGEDSARPDVRAARALEPLDGITELDVVEHPAAYDAVHRALSAMLPGDAGRR